jgi:hypothetical protein
VRTLQAVAASLLEKEKGGWLVLLPVCPSAVASFEEKMLS